MRLRAEVLSSSEIREDVEEVEIGEEETEEEVEKVGTKKSSTSSKFGIGIVIGSGEFMKSEPA
eukprot:CAMPEP_0174820302 /NCGR_PEP_ID=MMETSP1107-20130205/4026_1 /TAXON_ID=36770 /ORGANISM="Paraphysomonas vestita, Strain GFlagA" /LENGTH=62 /DNA_ID=CAMNT_0016035343 /DNA_START=1339 /DNA_END=1527 /DNA_ORIENTATION=+